MSDFSERLALRAKEMMLSQREIARRLGLAAPSVNAWFKGNVDSLRGENLQRLAEILQVSPEWLLVGSGAAAPALPDTPVRPIPFGSFRSIDGSIEFTPSVQPDLGVMARADYKVIQCPNDRLAPHLSKCDLLVIDSSVNEVEEGACFALFLDGFFSVARIGQSLRGAAVAISDCPPEAVELKDNYQVVGKVIYRVSRL